MGATMTSLRADHGAQMNYRAAPRPYFWVMGQAGSAELVKLALCGGVRVRSRGRVRPRPRPPARRRGPRFGKGEPHRIQPRLPGAGVRSLRHPRSAIRPP